ncbi:MAG: MGMT family protein [Patescibacteria group bacterium]|nr:MGMT family protein [Patescibacteria group bacterium]
MPQRSNFKQQVIALIKRVPRGKVMSYGQVAAFAGSPRAARQVGGILRAQGPGSGLPWWRIVNNQGAISIKGNWEADKRLQAELLKKEGIEVSKNFTINIDKYRFSGNKP